ncbi:hypothetical protein LVD17_07375 [Fulvivirga ulvae]|uniref:hypothetical protein n=1 Tax=Fulvivirga ulvae TaxID=2904245 RepID=UPI001F47992E|nr:hypothetical protein [Fulvivirga ulvae]UII33639.1 hypothetical protein LVD17_07375 [Fulvivirga ulvae]
MELHYVDQQRQWHKVKFPESYEFNTHPDKATHWHAGNSFAVVIAPDNPEYIFNWGENYNITARTNIGAIDDDAIVNIIGNDLVAIKYPQTQIMALRYEGGQWKSTSGMNYIYAPFSAPSYGEDIILYTDETTGKGKRNIFNPNYSNWGGSIDLSGGGYQQMAGPDGLFYNNYKFYKRQPDGAIVNVANTSGTSLSGKPHYGYGEEPYVAYTIGSNSYLQQFKNGQDAGLITLTGRKIDGAPCDGFNLAARQYISAQIIASFNGNCSDRATNIQLTYLNDGQASGMISKPVVTKIETHDGYQTRYTSFAYTSATAKTDAGGSTAQFNKVRVIPGSATASATPFGYSDTYFFNGLTSVESSLPFPTASADPYSCLRLVQGVSYASISYDKNGNNVAQTETSYSGLAYDHKDGAGNVIYQSKFVRRMNVYDQVDGLSSDVKYTYNSEGQLASETGENYNSFGNKDILTTTHKYWWEAYDPTLTGNFLGPIVQTKKKINNTIISSTATRWKTHSGKVNTSVPYRSYTWKGSGSPDFSAWNSTSNAAEWLLTSDIAERDSDFNVTLIKNQDDRYTTAVYDHHGLVVANIYNATPAEVLFADFDDHDLENSVGTWAATSYWQFENGVMKFDHSTQAANLYSLKGVPLNGTQIAEFDYKLIHGTGYLAYHFGKASASDTPTNSGYTVRVYTDAIKVYYQGTLLEGYNLANDKRWHHLTIRKGGKLKVLLDGVEIIETLTTYTYGNYDGLYATSGKAYVDNFRLYPEDAYATSTSYDKDYKYVLSSTGSDGLTTRNLHNTLGSSVASIGIDGTPSSTSSGYSCYRDQGSWVAADPNIIHSTAIKEKSGFYEDFTTANPYWVYQEYGNGVTASFSRIDGELMVSSPGGATDSSADLYYLDMQQELTGTVGVELMSEPYSRAITWG